MMRHHGACTETLRELKVHPHGRRREGLVAEGNSLQRGLPILSKPRVPVVVDSERQLASARAFLLVSNLVRT